MSINRESKNLKGFVNDPFIKDQVIVPYSLINNSRYKHIDELVLADGKTIKATMAKKDIGVLSNNLSIYVVTLADENRIDLVAYKLYGAASLYWILCYVNKIKDPLKLPIGTVLYYPDIRELRDFPNPLS